MTIVQCKPSHELNRSLEIPKKSSVKLNHPHYKHCKFTTTYDSSILPINIASMRFINTTSAADKSTLELTLKTLHNDIFFNELNLTKLRFFINGQPPFSFDFLEFLKLNLVNVSLLTTEASSKTITPSICKIDFIKQSMLPELSKSTPGHQLLLEFFAFPEKYLFFDICFAENVLCDHQSKELTLVFIFDREAKSFMNQIDSDFLKLNCLPLINLFTLQTEPVRINKTNEQHQLIPDYTIPIEQVEIYNVDDIKLHNQQAKTITTAPVFLGNYGSYQEQTNIHWHSTVKPTWEVDAADVPGYETFITLSKDSDCIEDETLTLLSMVTCCNREILEKVTTEPNKELFEFTTGHHENIESIEMLIPFSKLRRYPSAITNNQEIISLLRNSYQSLTDNETAFNYLKQSLQLHYFSTSQEVYGKSLVNVSVETIVLRHPATASYGFCNGLHISIKIDEEQLPNRDTLLFAEVIKDFLISKQPINTLFQITLMSLQRGKLWTWMPQIK